MWVTGQALTALSRKPFPVLAPKRRSPVTPAKAQSKPAATPAPKPIPKPKPAPHKSSVPIAHAAKKKQPLASHGQTIAPAKRPQTVPTAPAAHRVVPSTARAEKGSGHGGMVAALAAFAAATILLGAYLTRRRLSARA